MPFKHGKNTAVWFNGKDLSPILNAAGLEVNVDLSDVTTFQSGGWKNYLSGLAGASMTFGGFYDPTVTTIEDALAVDAGVLTYSPAGGVAIGDLTRLASVTGSNYSQGMPKDDAVAIGWTAMAEERVHFGYVLHTMSEDTNTTTGASRDDAAQTTTGWTAHLHVTLVDGGSWVIKLQDSADNSSWADVSGGAFTAATGATAQRLQSATATATLRRYVRYVATRTGGSAGDGVTFGLGLARTK